MKILSFLVLSLALFSSATYAAKKSAKAIPEEVGHAFVAYYSKHVFNSYTEVLKTNKELLAALQTFTKNPTLETQNAAKAAWSKARAAYSITEPYRYYGGPIDQAEGGVEGL